jgi:hypothetical protein
MRGQFGVERAAHAPSSTGVVQGSPPAVSAALARRSRAATAIRADVTGWAGGLTGGKEGRKGVGISWDNG